MDSSRIYVCHTHYHVLVTIMKELNIKDESRGQADIALSKVFIDFGDLKDRLKESQIFKNVLELDERRSDGFPEVAKYKENHNNILRHMINRIIYTKKMGKLQDRFIDINFKKYSDIYVFCDSDPIGYYLNYHHIRYHAIEDGLDCLKNFDAAHFDNRGHFKLKAFMAKLNLIFIQNGYSKYCIDMEINDDSYFDYSFKKYKVIPRKELEKSLNSEDKSRLLKVFLPEADSIKAKLAGKDDCVLFLTEGYPGNAPEIRKQIADQILREYCGDRASVIIKPHPRDDVDYASIYPECTVIKGKFPIEVMNYIEGIHFAKIISIITSAMDSISFADEKINIGPHIYDNYEPVEKHEFLFGAERKKKADKDV